MATKIGIPKAPKVSIPKAPALAKNTNPKAPQIKNSGLQGYLSSSKMKPFVKTIKSQLMPS